jgi:hypothetical protein
MFDGNGAGRACGLRLRRREWQEERESRPEEGEVVSHGADFRKAERSLSIAGTGKAWRVGIWTPIAREMKTGPAVQRELVKLL